MVAWDTPLATARMQDAKARGTPVGPIALHALIHAVLETACNAVQARTMQAWSPSDNPFEALRKSLEELWAARAERTDEALVVADLIALSLYDESLRPKLAEFYELGANQIRAYLEQNVMSLGLESRQISSFPHVVFQVVQMHSTIFEPLDQLVIANTD